MGTDLFNLLGLINPSPFPDVAFEKWIDNLVNRDWVSYCKAPFKGPKQVIEYVGRYTHRVAISNRRILSINDDDETVTFSYKDYADNSRWKEMTLDAEDFITRFLYHILPKRFHRIRHYGFLSNGNTAARQSAWESLTFDEELSIYVDDTPLNNQHVTCPACGRGRMEPIIVVDKLGRIVKGREYFWNPRFKIHQKATEN